MTSSKTQQQLYQRSDKKCYDFIGLNDENVEEYLKTPDNLIITDISLKNMLCGSIEMFKKFMSDTSMIYYQCNKTTGQADLLHPIIRIPAGSLEFHVSLQEFTLAVKNKNVWNFITFEPSEQTTERLISENIINGGSYVSGTHCQQGTNQQLFHVITYDIHSSKTAETYSDLAHLCDLVISGHDQEIKNYLQQGGNPNLLIGNVPVQSRYTMNGTPRTLMIHDTSLPLIIYYTKQQNLEMVKELLLHHAEVDAVGGMSHSTGLINAVIRHNIPLIELLIKYGADVNYIDSAEQTGLYVASREGDDAVVRVLLSHGAKCNSYGFDGTSPLYVSVQRKQLTTAQILLEHGANVNFPNSTQRRQFGNEYDYGNTPLYLACSRELKPFVELFLRYGANVNQRASHGQTPMEIAHQRGNSEIIKLLENIQ